MLIKTQITLIAAILGFATQAAAQSTNPLYNDMVNNNTASNRMYHEMLRGTIADDRTVTQDARSGNTYDTVRNPDGTTSTVGINQRTGSVWRSQTQPNGDQYGTDANGNLWQKKSGN